MVWGCWLSDGWAAVLIVLCDVRKSRITFGCLGCVWIAGKLITHARLNRERVAFEMRPLVTTSQVTSLVTTKTPTFDGEQSTGEQ